MLSSDLGHNEITRVLVAGGADIDMQSKQYGGNSAIGLAASRGHMDSVIALAEARANLELPSLCGATPLV